MAAFGALGLRDSRPLPGQVADEVVTGGVLGGHGKLRPVPVEAVRRFVRDIDDLVMEIGPGFPDNGMRACVVQVQHQCQLPMRQVLPLRRPRLATRLAELFHPLGQVAPLVLVYKSLSRMVGPMLESGEGNCRCVFFSLRAIR